MCCFKWWQKKINLPSRTITIPLGANKTTVNREKNGLHLLYVGTFINRNIHETIEGLALFHRKYPKIDISYKIIVTGDDTSEEKNNSAIEINNLKQIVSLIGYIQNDKLNPFFEKTNIGISYVPITDYFNHQPVTKTFEYLMSGMPVLATGTIENKLIINENNGVIIENSPESFSIGLEKINQLKTKFNEQEIVNSV